MRKKKNVDDDGAVRVGEVSLLAEYQGVWSKKEREAYDKEKKKEKEKKKLLDEISMMENNITKILL